MTETDERFAQLALASRGPVSISVKRDQGRSDLAEAENEDALQSNAPTWSFPRSFRSIEHQYRVLTSPTIINNPPISETDPLSGGDEEIESNAYSIQEQRGIPSEVLRHVSDSELRLDDQYQEANNCYVVLKLDQGVEESQRMALLRAGGVHGNKLLAGYIETLEEDGEETLSLQENVLHIFPTRICSIYSGNQEDTLQRGGNRRRICVRTVSSTVFADVSIEKGLKRGMSHIHLIGVLEIMHGKSTLSSGVQGRKKKNGFDQMQIKRSKSSISDVMFHPSLGDQALTIDRQGSLSLFQVESVSVTSSRWTTRTRWEKVSEADPSVVLPESSSYDQQWSLDWLADAGIAILTCPKGIFTVHLPTRGRECIFIAPIGNRIWSCKLLHEPRPLLWIITTTEICILEADPGLEFRQLISFAHERSSENGLYLVALDSQLTSQTVAVWDCSSQFLLTYTVFFEGVHGPISIQSRQDDLHTMKIGVLEQRAGPPLFVGAGNHQVLKHIHRQDRNLSSYDIDSIWFVIEFSSSGDVWISTIIQDEVQENSKGINAANHFTQSAISSNHEISAARTLHSLSEVYRALMKTNIEAGALHGSDEVFEGINGALQGWPSILKAEHTSMSTAFLPIELFASILQKSMTGEDVNYTSKPLSLHVCVNSQHLIYEHLRTFLDSFLHSINVEEIGLIKKYSFAPEDILSESGDALKIRDIVKRLATPFYGQLAQQSGSLKDNIRTASQEVATDLALTSISLMKKPTIDDSAPISWEESARSKKGKGKHIPDDVPVFTRSFFNSAGGESAEPMTTSKKTFKSKVGKVSLAAHLLLDEWTVGDDPAEYQFSHPYDDDDEEYMSYQNYSSSGRTTPDSNRSSSVRPSQNRSRTSSQVPPDALLQGSDSNHLLRSSQTIESAPSLLSSWDHHLRSNSINSPFHYPASTSNSLPAPESAPQTNTSSSQKQANKVRKKRRVGGF